jgi:hypothetical protein
VNIQKLICRIWEEKGRHKYTFQNVCLEDNSITLNDEAQKIILNTKGIITGREVGIILTKKVLNRSAEGYTIRHIQKNY